MPLKIATYNVRGLRDKRKRLAIFKYIKDQTIDICLLQETHYDETVKQSWETDWGSDIYFSGQSTNKEGVGFLINTTIDIKVVNAVEIYKGRLMAINIEYNGKQITVLNIYGPNRDNTDIFYKLQTFLNNDELRNVIIGGDWNVTLNETIDKKGGYQVTHKNCREKIKQIIQEHDLCDIWRTLHPQDKQYTWHSNKKPVTFCRLDYFLISGHLINYTRQANIQNSIRSDHSIALITIEINDITRGKGIFKMNNSLLLNEEFNIKIKESISNIKLNNSDASHQTLWELIKGTIRNETIKFSIIKKKQQNENKKQIEDEISKLKLLCDTKYDEYLLNKLNQLKSELNDLYDEEINGYLLRLKSQHIDNVDKNIKLLKQLEHNKSEKKTIRALNINNKLITEQKAILDEQYNYYKNLYSSKTLSDSTINFFDNDADIPKFNETEKEICEGPLTLHELEEAVKNMKNNKSPGTDGLNVEFYKIHWNDIKHDLLNSLNESYLNGNLTPLQKQSLITLLPKQDKDLTDLGNWRPISLLNIDYKIATKAIANRLKKVLNNIIHKSQTGFIKNRYIGENIRILHEAIEYTNKYDIPGMLLFTDFQKAFDSIEHSFIHKTLDFLNFGPSFKQWIKLFYNDPSSCVTNNGHISNFFAVERGVRQGCPLSPYIFILSIEILSHQIRNNPNIKGIVMHNKIFKNVMFADDATMILDGSKQSFETIINVFDQFGNTSGLRLNYNRCTVLKIGSLRNQHDLVYSRKKDIEWNSNQVKSLGITFHNSINKMIEINYLKKLLHKDALFKHWKGRQLNTMANITIFKTLILSQLTYVFTVLPNPPQNLLKTLKKKSFEFIWGYKPDKVKRTRITKDYKDGGLKMINIDIYLNSVKASWVKKLISSEIDGDWKYIYINELKPFGYEFLFKCNLNEKDVPQLGIKSKFLNDIITAWCKINYKQSGDNIIDKHIIWHNSDIKISGKILSNKSWVEKNVIYISDVYDFERKEFKSFNEFKQQFNIKTGDYLFYFKLIRSIPKHLIKHEQYDYKTSNFEIINNCKLNEVCKKLTHIQKSHSLDEKKDSYQVKWETKFNTVFEWNEINSVPFICTKNNKVQYFQYKFIHRLLATNSYLFKCGLKESNICSFCHSAIENIDHLFWECHHTQTFLNSLFRFLNEKHYNVNMNKYILFFCLTDSRQASFILMFAKLYIYNCKFLSMLPQFNIFKSKLLHHIYLEKIIALQNNNLEKTNKNWENIVG